MAMPVKSEHEHRQDRCSHVLEPISEADKKDLHTEGERDYKYRCIKCGKYLKQLSGTLRQRP